MCKVSLVSEIRTFSLVLIVSFSAILMTYFGVNYVLGGMHSYAG